MIFSSLVRIWFNRFDQFDRSSWPAELAGHLIGYLERGPDHLDYLFDISDWNLERLATGERWRRFRKPRIDVRMLVTSKQNLALEWAPRGRWSLTYNLTRLPAEWDFLSFNEYTVQGYGVPANRLVHLREYGHLVRGPALESRPLTAGQAHLLEATEQYLRSVVSLLKVAFDVEIVDDIELLHGKPAKGNVDWSGPVVGSRIFNVVGRRAELATAEAKEWELAQFGPVDLTAAQFTEAAKRCNRSATKTLRELQALTRKPITLAMVRRWVEGYEKRHGRLVPTSPANRPSNVVALRRRNEPEAP